MTTSSCACGAVRIEYTGDPIAKCVCHCLECRKSSGSTHALSLLVPSAIFRVTGDPASFSYKAASGSTVTRYFCRGCGINLYSDGEGAPGIKFVRGGAVDDSSLMERCRPDMELFIERRAGWLSAIEGAEQKEIM
ncbi:hypothetical protein FE257_006712 [Aspergillus nanangensis]|uniref:CENP-V/GFA domain-containing protein n=1 Tax=Aspergillus nanangensis TaxID=2582783 RepID=A0AAD4CPD1_ASPNN|nr:hypothetical protein FE257_006712 [Aspergillus nanangensis]